MTIPNPERLQPLRLERCIAGCVVILAGAVTAIVGAIVGAVSLLCLALVPLRAVGEWTASQTSVTYATILLGILVYTTRPGQRRRRRSEDAATSRGYILQPSFRPQFPRVMVCGVFAYLMAVTLIGHDGPGGVAGAVWAVCALVPALLALWLVLSRARRHADLRTLNESEQRVRAVALVFARHPHERWTTLAALTFGAVAAAGALGIPGAPGLGFLAVLTTLAVLVRRTPAPTDETTEDNTPAAKEQVDA